MVSVVVDEITAFPLIVSDGKPSSSLQDDATPKRAKRASRLSFWNDLRKFFIVIFVLN